MTCREMDRILIEASTAADLPETARDHLRTCSHCRALFAAMAQAPGDGGTLDPQLLDRVRTPILASVPRVRPLGPAGLFAAAFLSIVALVAAGGAGCLGVYGPQAMTPLQRVAIFAVLLAGAVLAAVTAAQHMRPGAKALRGSVLFLVALMAVETAFFALFHDYSLGRFVRWGTGCLGAGLGCALPAGMLVWLLIRRGYSVAPVSTGAAVGVVAGMAGLTALQLHCPILTIPHMAVWHGGILIGSVALGALVGWVVNVLRARRSCKDSYAAAGRRARSCFCIVASTR
ncbi:MAG TPA: NrsF family protein, partial [Bryobacteraceae bacterium]|nr:NrsF family protein [Bryobacteraceae bacterium]